MRTNLFASLFKYRPRPNRKPLEDFVTECMGYFLQNDKAFLENYLNLLLGENFQISDYRVETQSHLDSGHIIDVVILWSTHEMQYSLFVEHKVWSSPWEYKDDEGIKKDQISTYCNYQEKKAISGFRETFVVLISNYPVPGYSRDEKPLPSYLGNYTWSDISNLLKTHIYKSQQKNNIVKLENEFIEFMRREKMAGFEDFTIAELSSIALYKSYEEKRNSLITRVHQSFKKDEFKTYKLSRYFSWGGRNIGENFGVIFHDAETNTEEDVGYASCWVFFLLSLDEGEWFLKSLYPSVPDVICGFAKWFGNHKQLKDFKTKFGLNTWLKEQNDQFEVTTNDDNNWIAIIRRETLLYFLQRDNHEQEIVSFLQKGLKSITDKNGNLEKILRAFRVHNK